MRVKIFFLWGVLAVSSLNGQSMGQVLQCPNRPSLSDIFFLNLRLGWVVGDSGAILHSADAGETWTIQQSKTRQVLHAIQFIDPLNGWIAGQNGLILNTMDGGDSWNAQPSGTDRTLYDIQFIDAQSGWAVGCNVILATTDGGKSWTSQSFPFCASLFTVHFINSRNGWAVGGSHILRTNDGGIYWQIEECPMRICLYAVAFTDSLHGWIAGDAGTILQTADGGKTWKTIQTGRPIWLNNIRFCLPEMGCAAGVIYSDDESKGIILWTTDRGLTWQEQIYPLPIYSASFVDRETAWGAGEDSQLIRMNLSEVVTTEQPEK